MASYLPISYACNLPSTVPTSHFLLASVIRNESRDSNNTVTIEPHRLVGQRGAYNGSMETACVATAFANTDDVCCLRSQL